MSIHLLCYAHGNKHIRTHDVVHDIFTVITQDVKFHVRQEQLYVFPSTTLNSSIPPIGKLTFHSTKIEFAP
jgi:hypothetical protein